MITQTELNAIRAANLVLVSYDRASEGVHRVVVSRTWNGAVTTLRSARAVRRYLAASR